MAFTYIFSFNASLKHPMAVPKFTLTDTGLHQAYI